MLYLLAIYKEKTTFSVRFFKNDVDLQELRALDTRCRWVFLPIENKNDLYYCKYIDKKLFRDWMNKWTMVELPEVLENDRAVWHLIHETIMTKLLRSHPKEVVWHRWRRRDASMHTKIWQKRKKDEQISRALASAEEAKSNQTGAENLGNKDN